MDTYHLVLGDSQFGLVKVVFNSGLSHQVQKDDINVGGYLTLTDFSIIPQQQEVWMTKRAVVFVRGYQYKSPPTPDRVRLIEAGLDARSASAKVAQKLVQVNKKELNHGSSSESSEEDDDVGWSGDDFLLQNKVALVYVSTDAIKRCQVNSDIVLTTEHRSPFSDKGY